MGRTITVATYATVLLVIVASIHGLGTAYAAVSTSLVAAILRSSGRVDLSHPLSVSQRVVMEAPPPPERLAQGCVPLSQSFVASVAARNHLNLVIATFVNMAQADFGLNWLSHLRRVGMVDSAIIGATDAESEQAHIAFLVLL